MIVRAYANIDNIAEFTIAKQSLCTRRVKENKKH